MMGRTSWKLYLLFLLIPLSVLACRERKAPELSVRKPNQTEPTQDQNPDKQAPSADKTEQDEKSSVETKQSVIMIGNIENFNGKTWAVALLTIQDAKTGVIRFAETIPNQSTPSRFEVPYGSYIITLEYFADTAKTQRLAKSCSTEQNRIHQVNADIYNAELMVCVIANPDPGVSDVVIRPVVQ